MSAKQPRHVNDCRVENTEDELWRDANGEHEQCYRDYEDLFASQKVGERTATLCEWSAEKRLHRSHENDGCEEKTDHRNSRECRSHRERAFENQKLANKSVQPRQTERRKNCNTHPTTEQWCPLHQATEVFDGLMQ